MESAHVNLWELITDIASKPELHNSDKCKKILDQYPKVPGVSPFATELSLEVIDGVAWKIKAWDHNDSTNYVELSIDGSGNITITRGRKMPGDIYDTRTVQV